MSWMLVIGVAILLLGVGYMALDSSTKRAGNRAIEHVRRAFGFLDSARNLVCVQQRWDAESFGDIIVVFENDTLRVTVVRDRSQWSCSLGSRQSHASVDVLEALPVIGDARHEIGSRALARLHHDPGQAWTLVALAKEAGTSRTVLAQRFNHYLTESPARHDGRRVAAAR
jgi:hypothetical protein